MYIFRVLGNIKKHANVKKATLQYYVFLSHIQFNIEMINYNHQFKQITQRHLIRAQEEKGRTAFRHWKLKEEHTEHKLPFSAVMKTEALSTCGSSGVNTQAGKSIKYGSIILIRRFPVCGTCPM